MLFGKKVVGATLKLGKSALIRTGQTGKNVLTMTGKSGSMGLQKARNVAGNVGKSVINIGGGGTHTATPSMQVNTMDDMLAEEVVTDEPFATDTSEAGLASLVAGGGAGGSGGSPNSSRLKRVAMSTPLITELGRRPSSGRVLAAMEEGEESEGDPWALSISSSTSKGKEPR